MAHRRPPVAADERDVQQLRLLPDDLGSGGAIVGADRRCQCLRERVRADALLELGPMPEAVLARDDELRIAQTEWAGGYRGVIRMLELRMLPADAIERVALAATPRGEQLARLALRNIEMRALRQAPGYCGHNLSSR